MLGLHDASAVLEAFRSSNNLSSPKMQVDCARQALWTRQPPSQALLSLLSLLQMASLHLKRCMTATRTLYSSSTDTHSITQLCKHSWVFSLVKLRWTASEICRLPLWHRVSDQTSTRREASHTQKRQGRPRLQERQAQQMRRHLQTLSNRHSL